MTQSAYVKRIIDDKTAEVAVTRKNACGDGCASCGGCDKNQVLTAPAHNLIGAKPGDTVVIRSKSSKVFGAEALVYILPLVLFLLGYLICDMLSLKEGTSVVISLAGLVIGLAAAPVIQRLRRKKALLSDEIFCDIIEIEH